MKQLILSCRASIIALLLHTLIAAPLCAQSLQNQVDFMGEYYWQSPLYNPCFAGSTALPTIGVSGRWGSEGNNNPYTLNAFAHFYLDTIKSGIGIVSTYHRYDDTYTYNNEILPTNKTYFNANLLYNYLIRISDNAIMQLGAQVGVVHFKSIDPVYNNPYNPQSTILLNERSFKFNLGFGALFTVNNFYAGINFANSNEPTFQFTNPGIIYRVNRTLYVQSGYSFNINDKFYLQPSLMLQSPLMRIYGSGSTPILPLLDINLQFDYKHRLFTALAYRINGDPFFMSFKVGGRIKNTQLSLAYHLGKNNLNAAPQRIEAMVGFFLWNDAE